MRSRSPRRSPMPRSTRSTSIRRSAPASCSAAAATATPTAPTIPTRSSRWLVADPRAQPPRARADRLAVRAPRLPRGPLREGRARSAVRPRALRQRDRLVLRGRRQEPARVRPQARHHPVVRARRRLGVLSRCGPGRRAAAARTCALRRRASRRRPTARPAASIAIRSTPARSPRTGGPISRRSTTPTASAPAGRRRSPSGCRADPARRVTGPGDRVADWFAGSGTTAAVAQRLGRAVSSSPIASQRGCRVREAAHRAGRAARSSGNAALATARSAHLMPHACESRRAG